VSYAQTQRERRPRAKCEGRARTELLLVVLGGVAVRPSV